MQAQLAESLGLISQADFPGKWPDLLPQLVGQLQQHGGDYNALVGALTSANSIFHRFRGEVLAGDLDKELAQCQESFGHPLLEIARAVVTQLKQASEASSVAADPAALRLALTCARLALRIWYSLNYFGLSEIEFEMLSEFVGIFIFFLQYENASLVEIDPEKESVVDAVRAAVCENLTLLMRTEEEDFASGHLQPTVTAVWERLIKATSRPGQDRMVMGAIRFLITVARSTHRHLFGENTVLRQIVESIVLPNLRLRDEDEELFDMNYIEYVRRDAEGSDSDTRRRLACELVRALTEGFEAEVTKLGSGYVIQMLTAYAANPTTEWRAKDCAIYLVVALTMKGSTQALGATKTNTHVQLLDFYRQHVAPDLSSTTALPSPILWADALRFTTTFRSQLPREDLLATLPHIVQALGCKSNVVHSYAATLIERILALRTPAVAQAPYTKEDILPVLPQMLQRLFNAFEMPESEENEYVMRCLMRLVHFLGPALVGVAPTFLSLLGRVLLEVAKNPRTPAFSHYMF